ncbi:uncharacterized protein LY89DRAFT_772557 [Mollisia scopiformis]|uniref:Myb-like domain-containing protein n=1 Tax=Mollisia scopiformis TaxID=149040 RepID=A0A194XIE9_MOLSC|nr:uncharacterized protein LY89DRAFT_772557 [Mollisia scopiformis]KUJ19906.1 hypothetical protein LY89DRAFT_772557 [Mollisia scopiformis]
MKYERSKYCHPSSLSLHKVSKSPTLYNTWKTLCHSQTHKMPPKKAPKAAKDGPSDGMDSFALNHDESALLWAMMGEMNLLDRTKGITWDVVRGAVHSTTPEAAKRRWYTLCAKMEKKGHPLPESAGKAKPQPKEKKAAGKKGSKVEEADKEESEEEEEASGPALKANKRKGKGPEKPPKAKRPKKEELSSRTVESEDEASEEAQEVSREVIDD